MRVLSRQRCRRHAIPCTRSPAGERACFYEWGRHAELVAAGGPYTQFVAVHEQTPRTKSRERIVGAATWSSCQS